MPTIQQKPKSKTKLRSKLWKLFSEYVRRKERGICYTCGKRDEWKYMQAGHFVHRDCLDYNEKNIHCQCVGCNKWRHGNLVEYADRLERDYGPGVIQELKKLGNEIKIWKISELESMIEEYKIKLKKL